MTDIGRERNKRRPWISGGAGTRVVSLTLISFSKEKKKTQIHTK